MQISILFFAGLKDRAGTNRISVEVEEGATIAELKGVLGRQYPNLQPLIENAIASVNQEFAFNEDRVPEGAEVAFFPPVSGGSHPTILRVVEEPLDLDDLTAAITGETTGAVCIFTGIVRGKTSRGEGHETAALEYEAYVPMAEAKMGLVAEEIRQRWPSIEGIVIVQRIGHLAAGTPTVLIACAAAHRDTGVFEAARYGIDRLKEIVPIWKKEIGPGGETWIEGEYYPKRGD